jgi:hypothetical protein
MVLRPAALGTRPSTPLAGLAKEIPQHDAMPRTMDAHDEIRIAVAVVVEGRESPEPPFVPLRFVAQPGGQFPKPGFENLAAAVFVATHRPQHDLRFCCLVRAAVDGRQSRQN